MLQEYTLEGEFGTATDDFSHKGRVIERSTYGMIAYFFPVWIQLILFIKYCFRSLQLRQTILSKEMQWLYLK